MRHSSVLLVPLDLTAACTLTDFREPRAGAQPNAESVDQGEPSRGAPYRGGSLAEDPRDRAGRLGHRDADLVAGERRPHDSGAARGLRESFKEALNTILRAGLSARETDARTYSVPVRRLGLRPGIELDRAMHLAAALEDEGIIRKLKLRK